MDVHSEAIGVLITEDKGDHLSVYSIGSSRNTRARDTPRRCCNSQTGMLLRWGFKFSDRTPIGE
jgi:hypothetical protein